jgi:predicted  nucleic acid-binding Zn-ribbon protein
MNKEITKMEELQRYIDALLREKSEIDTAQNSIKRMKADHETASEALAIRDKSLKQLKKLTSILEMKLKELDASVAHISEKLHSAQNEKALNDGTNELAGVNKEKGDVEEEILLNFESISAEEKSLASDKDASVNQNEVDKLKIEELTERIARLEAFIKEKEEKFKTGLLDLSPPVRSRFSKLVQSKDGKALVKIDHGVCLGCNNNVPPHEVSQVNAGVVTTCTNCGKYLYSGS